MVVISRLKQAVSSCVNLLTPSSSSMAVRRGPCLLTEKKIQAFKTKCPRKHSHIYYLQHKTNKWVWSKISFLVGPQESLLATFKRRKLVQFVRIICWSSLFKTFLEEGGDGLTSGSAEEMLDGQHWKMAIPVHARIAYILKKIGKWSQSSHLSPSLDNQIGQGTELNMDRVLLTTMQSGQSWG